MRIVVPSGALVVLVGPAGSGKTTFARRHFRETEVVSSDRCRAMVSDDESDMSVSGRAFELFFEILRHRLELGRVAVADSTALTARARAKLRSLARRCGAPVVAVALDVPLEVCLARDATRARRVGREVIQRQCELMRRALERIPVEGYDAWYVLDARTQEEAEVEVRRDPRRLPSSLEVRGAAQNRRGEVRGMPIRKVGVVGCGLMGSGIAETCARHGYEVVVREVSEELLHRGLRRVQESMARAVERGKLSPEEREAAGARIRGTTRMQDLRDCDLIIEAAVERMDVKKEIWRELDQICPERTLFCSNTSSLSITEQASVTRRADRFCGMHFFNPVPVMKLVELVRGLQTSDETLEVCRRFAESLGKTVVVARDYPGFIVNLLLVPFLLDAVRALEKGLATKEDIDTAVRLGLNHPMGPFELLDFVGIDTTYYIAEAMFQEFKDPRYAPPVLLRQMTLAGHHGRKAGRGFYEYSR